MPISLTLGYIQNKKSTLALHLDAKLGAARDLCQLILKTTVRRYLERPTTGHEARYTQSI